MRKDKLEQYQTAVREQRDYLNNVSSDVDFTKDEAYVKRENAINSLLMWLEADKKSEDRERAFDHSVQTRSDVRANKPVEDAKAKQIRDFASYITTGDATMIHGQRADMASNGSTTGGYLVPTFVSAQVIQDLNAYESVRKAGAQVIEVQGNTNVPIMQDAVANFIVEDNSVTATDPTLAQAALRPQLLICKTAYSYQLANRSAANLVGEIQKAFVRGIAKTEAAKFLYGTGTNMPQGLVAGGTVGVTTASSSTFTGAELIQLHDAIDPQYAATGTWIMSPSAASIARTLESTNGAPLVTQFLSQGFETLYGRPVVIDANMNAATTGLKPIIFASVPDAYIIGEETSLQVLSDPYSAAGTGEIKLYVYKFVDGRVAKAAATSVMAFS